MYIYIYILSSSRKPSGSLFYGFRRRHHPTLFVWFPSFVSVWFPSSQETLFVWFPSLVFS